MSTKKKKKHDRVALQKYMHMLEEGISFSSIHRQYGIGEDRLKVIWALYQRKGVSGLQKGSNIKADFALKKEIVLDIEENHITLHAASLKYGATPQSISRWLNLYRQEGISALDRTKKRGRPPGMGRPKKNSNPLTELERLQKENRELKTEIHC